MVRHDPPHDQDAEELPPRSAHDERPDGPPPLALGLVLASAVLLVTGLAVGLAPPADRPGMAGRAHSLASPVAGPGVAAPFHYERAQAQHFLVGLDVAPSLPPGARPPAPDQ